MIEQKSVAARDLAVGDIVLHWDSLTPLRVVEASHTHLNDMCWLAFEAFWPDSTVAPISGDILGHEEFIRATFRAQTTEELMAKKVDKLRTELRGISRGQEPRPERIERMRKAQLVAWIEQCEAAQMTDFAARQGEWEEDDAQFDN